MIEDLLTPLTDYAPVTFWSLNDKLNQEEMERQLISFQQAGFGGVFLHSRVGLITLYMSKEWLDLIDKAVSFGAKLGLHMYLYDEDMWPSGYGGGIVPRKDEDFHEKALLYIDDGQLTQRDRLIKKHNGKSIVVRIAPSGCARFNGECFIDEMNPRAVQYFLETTHEKYFQKMKKKFGLGIKGIFTDEPCYNLHSFHAEPHTPFSEYAVDRYERNTGKRFVDGCHLLFCEEDGFREFRLDYYKAVAEQFEEAFTKQYANWCRAHGIELVGHFMAEETLAEQIAYTGGVMRHYKHFGIAGVDKLFRTNEQTLTLKQLTSITETFNKKRALSECFAGMGQETTFVERKRTIDWQAVNGINFVNTHLSHYSMRGERKRDYPPNLNYQQPYFETEKTNNEYIARLSRIIAESTRQVDVLVIVPYSTAVLEYNANDFNKELSVDKVLVALAKKLEENRVEYHLITEEDFASFADVVGDKIIVNAYTYHTLILPGVQNLSRINYQKIKSFSGEIYKIATQLSYIDGKSTDEKIDGKSFVDVDEFIKSTAFLDKVCQMEGQTEGVIATKRTLRGKDLLFIANKSLEKRKITVSLDKTYSFVSLMEGKIYSLDGAMRNGKIEFTLYPSGSIVLYEGKCARQNCLSGAYNDGVEFAFNHEENSLPFTMDVPKSNIMLLDRVSLYVDGKLVVDNSPTNAVWHHHYYPLKDGTPFIAEYTFQVQDVPVGELIALIENAENYDRITLNGKPLIPHRQYNEKQVFDDKSKIDVSLSVCPITFPLKKGENCIRIEGKKCNNISEVCGHRWVYDLDYAPTEVENIFIVGDFRVGFDKQLPYVRGVQEITEKNVTSAGFPFYSGKLVYRCQHSFKAGDEVVLQGDFAAAEVQTAYGKERITNLPFAFTVKEDCSNVIVEISNTLYPMYGPHRLKEYSARLWIDAGCHNEGCEETEEYRVLPFGLKSIIKRRKKDDKSSL